MRPGNPRVYFAGVLAWIALTVGGCATELPPIADKVQVSSGVVVGRVLAVITGETGRWYGPEVRFIELQDQQTQERFRVEVQSNDRYLALVLRPEHYSLTRVEINEGPFMSMAQLNIAFSVGNTPLTYLGTWRFGIDSPRYRRRVAVSMIIDQSERKEALAFVDEKYPALSKQPMVEMLPQPSQLEAQLFEVMPYPRSSYFRRHLW